MMSHTDLNLKPGDRLVCDWGEQDGHNYSIMVDAASGFLWAKEFPQKGTNEALQHLSEIPHFMGRYGECHSDNRPSYRKHGTPSWRGKASTWCTARGITPRVRALLRPMSTT